MESNGCDPDTEKSKETDEESHNEELEDLFEDKISDVDRRKILRSSIWDFFDVADVDQKVALCTLCQERFSFRSTSANLARHLQRKHLIEFVKEEHEASKVQQKRTNTSMAWEYFEVKDRKRRVATCKLCACSRSYWSSVSNLMKHVRRKHGLEINSQHDDSSGSQSTKHHLQGVTRSALWRYFKKLDSDAKIVMCLVCKKRLSYKSSTSNLQKHLNRTHPALKPEDDAKRVIISSDGQLYEVEDSKEEHLQNEDDEEQPIIDLDSVFIDDFDGDVLEKTENNKRKPVKEKRKKISIQDTYNSDDTSSDEITFRKKYVRKKSDSLEQFGKYLISLMKELPKELSNQLQMDFVKQVITAQLTYDAQQKGTVPSNGYAITITDNGQRNSDHQYVVEEQVIDTQ